MNVLDDFSDIFSTRQQLVLLPISRLVLEDEIHLGEFILYPPQSVDLAQLRTVRIRAIEGRTEFARSTCLDGQQLREQLTALTGCNLEVFSQSALLAFELHSIGTIPRRESPRSIRSPGTLKSNR